MSEFPKIDPQAFGEIVIPNPPSERKIRYYLGIAKAVAENSTCLRRKYGAIIVKNDEVISTGYNGGPRGCVNCNKLGFCMRNTIGAVKGSSYEVCVSVHAEMNAMLSASRRDMLGATLYIVGLEVESDKPMFAKPAPCLICHRLLINSGIEACYGFKDGPVTDDAPYEEIDISGLRFMKNMRDNVQKMALTLPEDVALEVAQKLAYVGIGGETYVPTAESVENPLIEVRRIVKETARDAGFSYFADERKD